MRYDWIKELPFSDYFPQEYMEIIEIVGIDKFLILLEHFGRTNLYFSLASVQPLQEEYIKRNRSLRPAELARKLDISERTVFRVLKGEKDNDDNFDLFETEE